MSTYWLGRLHVQRSSFGRAAKCFDEAIRYLESAGAAVESVRPLLSLGEVWFVQCGYEEALGYYEWSGELLRKNQMSRKYLASYVTLRRAEVHVELGALEEGRKLAEEAFEAFCKDQFMHGMVSCWMVFGDIATGKGAFGEAEGWYLRVLGLQGKKKSAFVEENGQGNAQLGRVLLRRAESELDEGKQARLMEEALVRCVTAFCVSRSLQNVVGQAKACMGVGQVLLRQGEVEGARACFDSAMGFLERLGVKGSVEECRRGLEAVGEWEEKAREESVIEVLQALRVAESTGREREVGEEMVEI